MTPHDSMSKLEVLMHEISFFKKQEEMYKSMMDKLQIGIIIIKDGIVISANQKLLNLLGYQAVDLIGAPFKVICPQKQSNHYSSEEVINNIQKNALHSPIEFTDWQFIAKNKKSINAEIVASILMGGEDVYVQVEVHEPAPKRSMARKLKEKAKEIETLSEERESLNEELRATLDELVEVNKQLSESESWNKSIVENIPLGLVVIQNREVEYINESLLKILGCRNAEIEWKSIEDPELYPEFVKIISEYKNENSNNECWIISKDGDKKYIRNQYVKLNDKSRWMVITTDLTNEKNRETEISNARERLEFAIEANQSVIWDVDDNDKEKFYNKGFGRLFGFDDSELSLTAHSWQEMIHPDDIKTVRKELKRHYNGDVPFYEAECRIKTKDGNYKWVLTRGKVISSDKSGIASRFIGIFVDISRSKTAEENLKFSEERFRTIVQHLSDIILIVKEDMSIMYESPAVSATFGYKQGHFLGQSIMNIVHPDDVNIAQYDFKEVISKSNDFKPTELRVRHKKGHWVYVEVVGNNLSDHPAIKGILITARNITERKENEVQLSLYRNHLERLVKKRTQEIEQMNAELIAINEELKATNEELVDKNEKLNEEIVKRIQTQMMLEVSENKFRSFLEQSTEGIALIDEQGLIVDWNKGMESIFRISREDIINTYVWEFDYRFLPDKRKTSEQFEQLRNSILDYFSNLNQSRVMTVEGIYQTMELKQKYLNVTIFPVITPNRKYLGRIFRDITGIKRAQEEIRRQSEELQLINESLEQQKSQLENTLQELQKTQAQLIQSEKMASLGLLTAGVAHEINNPVNYINTALEGLKITLADFLEIFHKYEEIKIDNIENKLLEIQQLKKSLDYPLLQQGISILINNMQTGIERITEIVKSLRTFARVEENELKFSNIHELLDTTLVMLHNLYKNKVEINKKYGTIPGINCYPGKLSQVFMNILSNAIQAIPGKGEIDITTRSTENTIIISISDTGTGIPENLREKIFEPFYTTKEAGKGTGLGLSITYGIIQQHQGKIEVKNRSDEKSGTEFLITIPTTLKQEARP